MAIERARNGEGPTLIEAETYRFRGHSLADPDELRLKSEKEAYAVSLHSPVDATPQTCKETISLWIKSFGQLPPSKSCPLS